ncbi:hypothetical protein JCM15831A_27760 [Asaia astilbis]
MKEAQTHHRDKDTERGEHELKIHCRLWRWSYSERGYCVDELEGMLSC